MSPSIRVVREALIDAFDHGHGGHLVTEDQQEQARELSLQVELQAFPAESATAGAG